MQLQELAPNLWGWEAAHPDWELVPGGGWKELDRLARGRRVHVLTTIASDSWLGSLGGRITPAQLRRELKLLVELPVRMVLVSHGRPVLRNGRAALRRALTA